MNQIGFTQLDYLVQPVIDDFYAFVTQPEQNNAWRHGASKGHQIAEVKVHRQKYSLLLLSLLQNQVVIKALQTFISQVDCVMSGKAQVADGFQGHPHIREKLHGFPTETAG